MAILTDGAGRPLEVPTPPPAGTPVEDVIAYLRASAAHNDRVAGLASGAFDRSLRRALRR